MSDKKTVLFLGKNDDWHTERALRFLRMHFDVTEHLGDWGALKPWDRWREYAVPEYAFSWEYDYIISYLSRWVVPAEILKKTRIANINFHPAPPSYPGIGCVNFALYDGASEYGATCHHMEPGVDTGDIIGVNDFDVYDSDNVESLLYRTYDYQLVLFYKIVDLIASGFPLYRNGAVWSRKPYTRKEFDALGIIKQGMPPDEVKRRVRAVTYKQYKPKIEIDGEFYELGVV